MFTINPRVDFAFKKLFGSEENKDILISLINSIVSEQDQVKDMFLLNPSNEKMHSTDKLSILDIKATDISGRQYNIEMQITDQVYYNQRALYYWSKLYTNQLHEGDAFSDLKKTISINILNFDYFDKEPSYHNIFKILHVASHASYFEDLELHFIELNKFDERINHIKTTLDRWATFLKKAHYYDKTTFPEELRVEPAIEKAFNRLNNLSLNQQERDIYEGRLKWLRDEAAALQKTREQSFKQGMQQGMQQGVEQGRQHEKWTIAKKMVQRGIPIHMIIEDTGLSKDEIQQLVMTEEVL